MQEKVSFFFALLMQRYQLDRAGFEVLPAPMQAQIKTKLDSLPDQPLVELTQIDPTTLLEQIHYSWIIEALDKYDPATKSVMIASLHAKTAYPILQHFKLKPPGKMSSTVIRDVAHQLLIHAICPKAPLPKTALPKTFFNELLYFTKNNLEELFDHLGLYDLASELQEIVDKNIYLQVFEQITKQEKNHLMEILSRKQLWALPKLGIQGWLKEKQGLRFVLQKRGLMRFCIGMSGSHRDFVWYLTRKLDTARGRTIEQLIKNEPIQPATKMVQKQILHAIERKKGAAIS